MNRDWGGPPLGVRYTTGLLCHAVALRSDTIVNKLDRAMREMRLTEPLCLQTTGICMPLSWHTPTMTFFHFFFYGLAAETSHTIVCVRVACVKRALGMRLVGNSISLGKLCEVNLQLGGASWRVRWSHEPFWRTFVTSFVVWFEYVIALFYALNEHVFLHHEPIS